MARKPGRPKKHVGLGPELRQVSDGSTMSVMQEALTRQDQPILFPSRPPQAPRNGGSGLSSSPAGDDGGRGAGNLQASVPEPARLGVDETDLRLTALVKKILREVAAPELQDDRSGVMTNAEILVRGIVRDALRGDKAAREMVVDRAEGKAVRGQVVQVADTSVEDQIDEATVALLNGLSAKKD